MKFEELGIKSVYDSEQNSVYYDFFNTVLKNSTKYSRFGGLFSGKKFVQCADGLQEFFKENNGHMELVIIPVFDKKDIEAFKEKSKLKIITEKWKVELDKIKDTLEQNHVKALAWMITYGYLTIKLILPQHEDGTPLTIEELKDQDVFRNEVGIFYNKEEGNEPLSFHGNVDLDNKEFADGYIHLRTSRQWIDSEKESIETDFKKFDNFWQNDTCQIGKITCKIEPLTDELIEYFKQKAPESKEDIPTLKKLPELRPYQKDAVEAWLENGGIGIFEMGTGTGKTFTALGCIKELEKKHPNLLVLITAPYTNLVDQWKEETKKWYLDPPARILDKNWKTTISHEIHELNRTKKKSATVLICTHAKFARGELIREIEKSEIPMMLIVDEAHHVGAGNIEKDDDGVSTTEGSRKGLSPKYRYRLALSATIDRHHDDEGTIFLRKYFTGITTDTVAEYSLEKAIADDRLCKYYYYPSFVELTDEEFTRYKVMTIAAVRKLRSKKPEERLKGENLIKKRALIIRDAEEKMNIFPEIMKKILDIRHLLIFCSENQYDRVEEILDNPSDNFNYDKRVDHTRITYKDPIKKKDRIKILKNFADEDYHIILSNRVLDEGMDVPQAKNCIILASTTNPTQFIQRRGRVLRKYEEPYKDGTKKEYAYIYDVLVKPKINEMGDLPKDEKVTVEDIQEAKKYEIRIIRNQLTKIQQMSELASNKDYCMEKIHEFTDGLPSECFEYSSGYR